MQPIWRSLRAFGSGLLLPTWAVVLTCLMALVAPIPSASAQGTAFTYQGQLNDGASPGNGNYDLQFTIYDAPTGGGMQGGPLTNALTAVSNGLFTVTLDFGANPFSGADRWLEIGVRTNGSAGAYQTLAPRQQLTATPYATRAANFSGAVSDGQLSANIARLNANQTFSGSNNISGSFNGNGSGLTSLNASQLSNGTLADARLSGNVALLSSNQTFTGQNTFSNSVVGGGLALDTSSAAGAFNLRNTNGIRSSLGLAHGSGDFSSDALAGDTVLRSSAGKLLLQSGSGASAIAVTTNNLVGIGKANPATTLDVAGTLAANNIVGNGPGLTNLSATSLTGTLADARLSSNVALLNASQTFSGPVNFSSGSNNFSGSFSGSGAGLSNITGVVPLQIAPGTNILAQANRAYDATNSTQTLFTLPSGSNFGDVVRVNGLGAGGWQVKPGAGQIIDNYQAGLVWTACASLQAWNGVASSADGSKLVAAANNGQIYTSTDSGNNWIARDSVRGWQSVASSSDGVKLVALNYGGQIYTSSDSGANWTARDSSRSWWSVASSTDGSKLVAVAYNDQIYTSTDSGTNWIARENIRLWWGVASSADGSKLVAVVRNGQIYTSTDSGTNWSAHASSQAWHSVASSADGTKLAAGIAGGQIYTSTDSGVSWTARDSSRQWYSVASSADGSKLVAVDFGTLNGGQIYTSTDGGTNWTARESNRKWYSVASSADGANLIAANNPGQLYTSTATLLTGGQGSSVELQYMGNGVWVRVTFPQSASNGPNTTVVRDANGNFSAGTISASTFSGDGSSLTGLSASAVSSGTVSDARLSTNVALLNATQSFTGQNTFINSVARGGLAVDASSASGGFLLKYGFGYSILGVDNGSANLSIDAFPGDTVLSSGTGNLLLLQGNGNATIAVVGGNRVGIGKLNPATILDVNGTATATSFSGDGSGLTGLNWSALSSPVPDGKLSANVPLLNGQNTFLNSVVGGGVTLDASSAAGAFNLKYTNGVRASFGLATIAGNYSSDATAGDTVMRVTAGKLLLQSGSGASALTISSNNLVGIGKTNPGSTLDVGGTLTAAALNVTGTAATTSLNVSGTATAAALGVGTNAPATALHVVASGDTEVSVQSTDTGGHRWTLQSSGAGTPGLSGTFQVIDRTGGASRLMIDTAGKVGTGANNLFVTGGGENLRIVRGAVNADGSIASGAGFTVSKSGTGMYTITFTTAFTDLPAVTATAITDGVTSWDSLASGSVGIGVHSGSVVGGNRADRQFTFIAIGSR